MFGQPIRATTVLGLLISAAAVVLLTTATGRSGKQLGRQVQDWCAGQTSSAHGADRSCR